MPDTEETVDEAAKRRTTDATKRRTRRGQLKGAVTRYIKRLQAAVVEEDKPMVETTIKGITDAFRVFTRAHDECLAKNDYDPDAEKYLEEAQEPYVIALREAKAFLKSNNSSQLEGFLANLPPLQLPQFDGNPVDFPVFERSFYELVHKAPISDMGKLTRLLQFTHGRAHEAIKACIHSPDGYQAARDILSRRFGDAYLITERLVADLRTGGNVHHPAEIRQLSDDLQTSLRTLRSLGTLSEVEGQRFILEVVQRFPLHVQLHWKKRALDTKRGSQHYPHVEDFAAFITEEADDATDPVYGHIGHKKTHPEEEKRPPRSSLVSHTSGTDAANEQGANARRRPPLCPCLMCSGSHKLFHCPMFKRHTLNERIDFVRRRNLCNICFSNDHASNECENTYVCTIEGCGEKHARLIHDESIARNAAALNSNSGVLASACIPTVEVRTKDARVFAVLDTASDASFCSRELVKALQLKGKVISLSLSTLHGKHSSQSEIVDIEVTSIDHSCKLLLTNVFVVDAIPVNTATYVTDLPHLRDLVINSPAAHSTHLLIGQDNAEALIPLEVRRGEPGEPFAVKTLFGWSMNGPVRGASQVKGVVKSCNFVTASVQGDTKLDEKLMKWWSIEDEGMSSAITMAHSREDEGVLEYWDKELKLIDNHFQLPIPWRPDVDFPDNRQVALHRLRITKGKLLKDNSFAQYDGEVKKLFDKGYCERAPLTPLSDKVWYLPHHAVRGKRNPEKLRIVFDCAARYKGKSLNDKCFSGPDLNNRLLHVLLRFRLHPFAFTADIEAMYYQVLIPPHERDALRFLWFDDAGTVMELRMTRHLFGGVWCASSATYAMRKAINIDHEVPSEVADTINRSFYVDDCLKSTEDADELLRVARGTVKTLRAGGFKLTKFVSTSPLLLSHLPEADKVYGDKEIGPADQSKVLGVKWDVMRDEFRFNCDPGSAAFTTRRLMLSFVSSIFDPLGLIGPMMVRGKVLLQHVTQMQLPWDAPVPSGVLLEWNSWLLVLNRLCLLQVTRCVKPLLAADCSSELHHFSDASEQAYGCCSYLRITDSSGCVSVALILSKSRVAPLKQLSIPRLELQAAVMAAKVDLVLRAELDITLARSVFWTDSEIVLKYIASESRRFHTFVANRISAITTITGVDQWRHVPSDKNVADVISRGHDITSDKTTFWFSGPTFLRDCKSTWQEPQSTILKEDIELKREPLSLVTVAEPTPINTLISHYSDFFALKRAAAWLIRFSRFFASGTTDRSCLSVRDLEEAESLLLRYVQHSLFSKEIERLSSGRPLSSSSGIIRLDPILGDDGLLRVGGRLRRLTSEDSSLSSQPIIVPHKHPIARLIADFFHKQAHVGTEWVVSEIRSKYWITHARAVVKRVRFDCRRCRRLFNPPLSQKMADLPLSRIEPYSAPFSNCGVDCFGPFIVKRARSEIKRWGCIFCCFQTRAVHLEMLDSMDTDSFINAFRRFIARRGLPAKVYSDNGTNFVGAQRALIPHSTSLTQYCLSRGVEWVFQPPHASHMGGVWERLIRVTRKVMAGLLPSNIRLTDESLRTLLCEAEAIINSRPLTKVSEDPSDGTALSPSHLLLLNQAPVLAPDDFHEVDLYRKRWRCIQALSDQFWRKWIKEYLPELQKRQKWHKARENARVGDIVLLKDETVPRGVWPMGLVTSVNVSDDGLVRSVVVRVKSGALLRRPISKIVYLETASV